MPADIMISVVTPVYGRELNLSLLCERLGKSLSTITQQYEIIIVNDQKPAGEWELIRELALRDARIRGVNLSRNFGQHQAIIAGLSFVRGRWVVVMDCDLQDRPEEIPRLYQKAVEGYDAVLGRRKNRKDSWGNRLTSNLFYCFFNRLTGLNLNCGIAVFGIYSTKVIEAVMSINDRAQVLPLQTIALGFHRAEIDVQHGCRQSGQTGYTFSKRFDLAIDIIIAYSRYPLRLMLKLGLFIFLIGLLSEAGLLGGLLIGRIARVEWAIFLSLLLLLSGMFLVSLGFVGLCIRKVHDEIRQAHTYIVGRTTF